MKLIPSSAPSGVCSRRKHFRYFPPGVQSKKLRVDVEPPGAVAGLRPSRWEDRQALVCNCVHVAAIISSCPVHGQRARVRAVVHCRRHEQCSTVKRSRRCRRRTRRRARRGVVTTSQITSFQPKPPNSGPTAHNRYGAASWAGKITAMPAGNCTRCILGCVSFGFSQRILLQICMPTQTGNFVGKQ